MTTSNETVVRSYFDTIPSGELDDLASLVAEDASRHFPLSDPIVGPGAIRQFYEGVFNIYSKRSDRVSRLFLSQDESVAAEIHFGGRTSAGKEGTCDAVDLFTLAEGNIQKLQIFCDSPGVMKMLETLPILFDAGLSKNGLTHNMDVLGINPQERDGKWQPDPPIHDDQAVVIHVKDKGLVNLTGCGHAGVINTVRHVQEVSGVKKVCAVIGGFHLSGALFDPIVPPTLAPFKQLNLAVVVPAHCAGWKATHTITPQMPEAFVQNSLGTRFVV